jgi:hypothetical protein
MKIAVPGGGNGSYAAAGDRAATAGIAKAVRCAGLIVAPAFAGNKLAERFAPHLAGEQTFPASRDPSARVPVDECVACKRVSR